MSKWLGQLRLFVDDNAAAFAIVLAVLVLAGGFVTYTTHVSPGTEIEQRETATWSSTASYTHQATVQEETPVFAENETLTDQSVYLQSIAPELNGSFQYSYRASAGGSLTANATVSLVMRSVSEETEFWREERELATAAEQSLGPNEQLTVPFSINITDQQRRVETIESQLGGTPGTAAFTVQTTLTLTGQRNGEPVEQTRNHTFSIDSEGQTYSVAGDTADTDGGEQTERERVTASYGPLRSAGGPILAVFSLVALGVLAVLWATDSLALSEAERDWLAFQSDLDTFEEWVSRGTVPDDSGTTGTIEIDSLEGLVDVAIDSNRRVVFDESRNQFVVVLEETRYRYDPPNPPGDDPLAVSGTSVETPAEGETDQTDDSDETS